MTPCVNLLVVYLFYNNIHKGNAKVCYYLSLFPVTLSVKR